MLFRKKILRSCAYCAYGTKFSEEQILCTKHGVVDADRACRKFEYDPCKRIPAKPKAVNFSQYTEDDFKL